MTIGFGVIGCGTISHFHAAAIKALDNARLVGCFSRRSTSSQTFAERHDCRVFGSLQEMLADQNIQVVTICTPSGAHLEPAVAAAQAGKHVVIEKPLEVTLERCDTIIQACKQAGTLLSVVFQSRFHGAVQRLKHAIESGRFGTVVLANAYVKWYRTQEYYDSGAWRGTWHLDGGGALMNQAIHNIDLLLWMMGPVTELTAFTATLGHERIEVEDTAVASLRFKNGALGSIEATTSAFPGSLKRIEIYGSQGSAIVEEESIKLWQFARPLPEDAAIVAQSTQQTSGGGAGDPTAISYVGHTKQFQDIIDAIQDKRSPLIDGHAARTSVEIICGIYQSAAERRTIVFDH
ncbi:MAG TPA: Gfo/Idh/MocA family oxidoreductase [Pirellulaceae bacterium]|nr:Gfo/Idh/MocA family oxidoreductase [Pirellulaceae bacterium]HMO90981.1 Gfo/Idh/MocA family oxidoreductase [Pirellulaceae bacterium]HMP68096.1 Gfo/Idh/MocA family oxidoreductase [Pirellulaceae bacterium]